MPGPHVGTKVALQALTPNLLVPPVQLDKTLLSIQQCQTRLGATYNVNFNTNAMICAASKAPCLLHWAPQRATWSASCMLRAYMLPAPTEPRP